MFDVTEVNQYRSLKYNGDCWKECLQKWLREKKSVNSAFYLLTLAYKVTEA